MKFLTVFLISVYVTSRSIGGYSAGGLAVEVVYLGGRPRRVDHLRDIHAVYGDGLHPRRWAFQLRLRRCGRGAHGVVQLLVACFRGVRARGGAAVPRIR